MQQGALGDKNIGIFLHSTGPQIVWGDRERMHQVITNLLTNAIKYTKKNGKVKISFIKSKKEIVTKIRDNGIGIRTKDMPKLFTKF